MTTHGAAGDGDDGSAGGEGAAGLAWLTERPIAHRGWHAAGDAGGTGRENTPTAFLAAAAAGFAIELDVRASSDGEAMVFHDASLDRLTAERGPLAARSAAALGQIEVGGDAIPTLADIMALVGDRVPLVIEVKGDGEDDATIKALSERTVELVRRHRDRAAIMSFDHRVLRACAALGHSCGLTAEGADAAALAPHGAVAGNAAFLSYSVDDLVVEGVPNPFVAAFRASCRPVITWTVRRPEQVRLTFEHADQMTFEGFDPRAG